MQKVLISYFSATGTTKNVAEQLATILNGDLFEIDPKTKYTSEDLDWTNQNSRSSVEMNDRSYRPEVLNRIENIDNYDTILIGFPVWWYTAPTIINTFIEENNLTGKDVYIFVTSGSSGVDSSFNDLKNMYSNINFISGKRLNNIDRDDIINWIGD